MKRILRLVFIAAIAASPALAQIPEPPETPPTQDETVLGTYNITTNGTSDIYRLNPNDPTATRQEQEHGVWILTFKKIGTAYCYLPRLTQWTHVTVTTKTQLNLITTQTKTSISGQSPRDQPSPTPCNQSRAQTFPLDTTGTLKVTAVTPLATPNSPARYHKQYRALALPGGTSLPDMIVDIDTVVTDMHGKKISETKLPSQLWTASVAIARWDKANWTTAYSGNISVQNDYATYITPEGDEWLTINATWNLQPN